MAVLEPEFLELTRALDVAGCWQENDRCQALDTALQAMTDLYCSGCKYCRPCPNGIEIPGIFEQYNLGRVYGVWDHARKVYSWWTKQEQHAQRCTASGLCEDKCPQHLPIRQQLQLAHAALA